MKTNDKNYDCEKIIDKNISARMEEKKSGSKDNKKMIMREM